MLACWCCCSHLIMNLFFLRCAGLRLMGIGRNQYIDLMNQCRSSKVRTALVVKRANVNIYPWACAKLVFPFDSNYSNSVASLWRHFEYCVWSSAKITRAQMAGVCTHVFEAASIFPLYPVRYLFPPRRNSSAGKRHVTSCLPNPWRSQWSPGGWCRRATSPRMISGYGRHITPAWSSQSPAPAPAPRGSAWSQSLEAGAAGAAWER